MPEFTMGEMNIQTKSVFRLVLAAVLVLSVFRPAASAQTTDPFYQKWLETGEASYFARNYAEAIKSLEIAVFGLSREKEAQAKGYVYLALCRAALGQTETASAALAGAAENLGWDGLRTMDLRFEARRDLDKLLVKHAPAAPTEPSKAAADTKTSEDKAPPIEVISVPDEKKAEEAVPETPPAATEAALPGMGPESGAASIGDLRRTIEVEPRKAAAYYDLAFLYRQVRDYRNARETLERLIDRNPTEIRAHLEIGRVDYLAGNAKSAVKTLEKFLSLTANVPVEERFRDEGLAFLLLSASARGDRKKVARLLADAEGLYRPERLEKLTLDPADLERLRALRQPPAK